MKTRVIQTKTWKDNWVHQLSKNGKLLFLYVLTNGEANMTGIYELNPVEVKLWLCLKDDELTAAMQELSPKVIFLNGWVKIYNHEKYNTYGKGTQARAYQKELDLIPEWILKLESTPTIPKPVEIKKIKEKRVNPYPNLESIKTPEFIANYSKTKGISENDIKKTISKMENWILAKQKPYINYLGALNTWIGKELDDNKIKQVYVQETGVSSVSKEERDLVNSLKKK